MDTQQILHVILWSALISAAMGIPPALETTLERSNPDVSIINEVREAAVKNCVEEGEHTNPSEDYFFPNSRVSGGRCLLVKDLSAGAKRARKSWLQNEGKVKLLEEYSEELDELQKELEAQFKRLLDYDRHNEILPKATELVQESKQYISRLITWKFLELGNSGRKNAVADESEPSDLPDHIWEPIFDKLSVPLFGKIQKLITNHNIIFADLYLQFYPRCNTLAAWEYVFKILDFLFENELISPQAIQSMFQKEDLVYQYVYYAKTFLQIKTQYASKWMSMANLTDVWSEPYLNKFCQALTRRERNTINFIFRVESLKSGGKPLYAGSRYGGFEGFSCQKYVDKFSSFDEPTYPNPSQSGNNEPPLPVRSELNQEDVKEIVRHLVINHPKATSIDDPESGKLARVLVFNTVNLFLFIEEELHTRAFSELLMAPEFVMILRTSLGFKPPEPRRAPQDLLKLVKRMARYHIARNRYEWGGNQAAIEDMLDEMAGSFGEFGEKHRKQLQDFLKFDFL